MLFPRNCLPRISAVAGHLIVESSLGVPILRAATCRRWSRLNAAPYGREFGVVHMHALEGGIPTYHVYLLGTHMHEAETPLRVLNHGSRPKPGRDAEVAGVRTVKKAVRHACGD